MSIKSEQGKHSGTFSISPDHHIFGELKIAGAKSKLRLHSPDPFPTNRIPFNCITGTLNNLTKVSLLNCVTPQIPGHSSGAKGAYYFAQILPHYMVLGDQFIYPHDEVVMELVVYAKDATNIFHDFDAFGAVFFDAEQLVRHIIENESHKRERRTGPNARVLYYAGYDEIVNANSVLGRIKVEHKPGFNGGGRHEGGLLRDEVAISLQFEHPVVFHEAVRRIERIIEYIGIIAGRPQDIKHLYVGTQESLKVHSLLTVHWVMYTGRKSPAPNAAPSTIDVLLDGVREPDRFASVMTNWLDRQESWHEARWRFFRSFAEERHYDINRIIGSANMFDILPGSAVPPDNLLSTEVIVAQAKCRDMFRALPASPERDSVLGCLGRLGKSSLKRKIRHRAEMLRSEADGYFADICKITDEAVNCRNFYVHGSPGSFDYEPNFDMVVFFTETLEFVFAVSDLIEAGWNFGQWMKQGSTMSHPFGRYKVNYRYAVERMLTLLKPVVQAQV